MTQDEIIELAKQAGLYVAHDSEGHFSGVTNEEIIDMYPDPDKERDRIFRESIFIKVLMPFAKLVAAKAFPDGVDAEWIARRTKYAVEQERANNALLCYQQRKYWDALACSDAIRAGTRARVEA